MKGIVHSSFLARMRNWNGQRGEDDRRIHVRRMVGGVNGDGMLAEVFSPKYYEARAGDFDAAASPDLRDAVLDATALFE